MKYAPIESGIRNTITIDIRTTIKKIALIINATMLNTNPAPVLYVRLFLLARLIPMMPKTSPDTPRVNQSETIDITPNTSDGV